MRTWILRVHLYGGLFASAYLMVFGLSSLNFNHHFLDDTFRTDHVWTRTLAPLGPAPTASGAETAEERVARAEALRSALGLAGYVLPWKTRVADDGTFFTEVFRPARSYLISLGPDGSATIDARHASAWLMVMALHSFGGLPGAPWLASWTVYTELVTWLVLFMAVSGVHLWTARKRERRPGLWVLVGIGALTLGFFVFIVVEG